MRRSLLFTSMIIASLGANAAAQSLGPIPRATFLNVMDGEFGKMDADKNGEVTRAEVEGFQRAIAVVESGKRNRALFQQLDSDRNGQISPAEFSRMTPPDAVNARPLIAQYDRDKNGRVSKVEYRSVKLLRFDTIDTDKDGVASVVEQRAAGLIK
jgi:hypothetical protein